MSNFKYLFQFYPTQSCRGKIIKINFWQIELDKVGFTMLQTLNKDIKAS